MVRINETWYGMNRENEFPNLDRGGCSIVGVEIDRFPRVVQASSHVRMEKVIAARQAISLQQLDTQAILSETIHKVRVALQS